MSKPILIGLTGPAGVGKSFIANSLWRHEDYKRVSFGSGIKAAMVGLLKYAGYSESDATHLAHVNKDTSSDALSQLTSRDIQIAIGQGVREIEPNFWCNLAGREITNLLALGYSVVVDDVRQYNEVLTIHSLGGVIVKLLPGPASKLTGAPDLSGMATLPFDVQYQIKSPDQYPNGNIGLDVHNTAWRIMNGK